MGVFSGLDIIHKSNVSQQILNWTSSRCVQQIPIVGVLDPWIQDTIVTQFSQSGVSNISRNIPGMRYSSIDGNTNGKYNSHTKMRQS